nr:hypothetical protein [Rhodoplanes roseus]
MAQRLDVDDAGDEGRAVGVALLADDLAAVVDDHRLAAAGVDAGLALRIEVVAADVGRHDVHVVLERAAAVGDLEEVVLGERGRQRGAVHHLGAVHGEAAAVLRIAPLHRHHDAEPADLGVGDRPKGLERAAVFLDPPVVDVVRRHRALHRQQRAELVVLEDDRAVRVDDEADVEEAVLPVRMAGLGLRHDVDVPLARELGDLVRLRARDVDRAGVGEVGVVDVQDLVVEAHQAALGNGEEADRDVEVGQPEGRLGQALQMLDVVLDVVARADAPEGRNEADRVVRLDHEMFPLRPRAGRLRPRTGAGTSVRAGKCAFRFRRASRRADRGRAIPCRSHDFSLERRAPDRLISRSGCTRPRSSPVSPEE